jgi:hypothetical protein
MWRFDSVAGSGKGSQLSSIEKISDSQSITERSGLVLIARSLRSHNLKQNLEAPIVNCKSYFTNCNNSVQRKVDMKLCAT